MAPRAVRRRAGPAELTDWPASVAGLIEHQQELGRSSPACWRPGSAYSLGGCFVCFPRGRPSGPGAAGDPAWAAAALARPDRSGVTEVVTGTAGWAFEPGLLALREGALLEAAVRALPELPDVLLVDATGRDHPRRAGLALHLGAVLAVPTVGVTHRPLRAEGAWPEDVRGAAAPLRLGSETVGCWVRTRVGTRPLAVHAAWRTDAATAVVVVLAATRSTRTPEPLRCARRAARVARARGG